MTLTRLPRHVVRNSGVLAYERPNDDGLCALCDTRAVGFFEPPGGPRIAVCERHHTRLDNLTWPGRGRSHAVPYPAAGRTLCGRDTSRVRVSATTTCRTCERIHTRLRAQADEEWRRRRGQMPARLRWGGTRGRWIAEYEPTPRALRRPIETVRVTTGVL